jgi:hypothetical protein
MTTKSTNIPNLNSNNRRSQPKAGRHVKSSILGRILAGCLLIAFAPSANAQTTNVYYSGFETSQDLDDWAFSGPWEIGIPTFGPQTNLLGNRAFAGTNCAATVLGGNYSDNSSGRLESKSFIVPSVANNPRLRWAQWYAFNSSDSGRLQVSVGAGAWTDLTAYPTLTGSGSGAWSEAEVDLSAYAGQNIRVGFLFTSATTGGVSDPTRVGPGWYIDEVRVVTGSLTFNNPEGFEDGWGGFHVEGGSWEVGTPAQGVGPGQAHTGTRCVGTVLNGNYADGFGSVGANFGRLVSPPFLVPAVNQNPRLRWANWYAFNSSDSGRLQVKVGAGAWTDLTAYPTLTGSGSGAWSEAEVDLSAYAGQNIRVGFLFTSATTGGVSDPTRVGPGWYIDEVRVVTGSLTFNNPEGFEDGWGGFHVEGGSWEVGTPAQGVGPGQAHTGTRCVGTVLNGNYADGFGSVGANFGRLVSPPFLVPPAVTNPRMRFWHWHSFNSDDLGQVQVKVGTDNWQTFATYTSTSSGVWSRPDVNLSAYEGQTIQLGFRFISSRTSGVANPIRVGPGWYIDEVRLLHDFSLALGDSPIMRAQDDTCIPLAIAASTLTPTVSFALQAPAGHLGSLALNTEGCWSGGLTSLADSQWLVSLTNSCSAAAMGVETVGTLCFTAVSAQSAFVPLAISDLNAGVSPTHTFGSRAVVIANEPLLEAWLDQSGQRMVTLYGKANTTYGLLQSTDLTAPRPWAFGWSGTVPASLFLDMPVQGSLSNAPILFLDATEQ